MAPVQIRDLSKHFGAVAAVNHPTSPPGPPGIGRSEHPPSTPIAQRPKRRTASNAKRSKSRRY